MSGLARRLGQLEAMFGPPIVEAPPKAETGPGSIDWSPEDRLILSQHARWRVIQLRNMLVATPGQPQWRAELEELLAGAPDRCSCCEAWPMSSIRVDHDGTVRCGACQSLKEFLPPAECGYFGHPKECGCDYDPVGELRWRWFWPLLEEEAQQTLVEWYRHQRRRYGGSAA